MPPVPPQFLHLCFIDVHEFSMVHCSSSSYCTLPVVMIAFLLSITVVVLVVIVPVVVVLVVQMYVAGFVLQCPSPLQVAVMVSLGNKPSSQVKVMDDPSKVVV